MFPWPRHNIVMDMPVALRQRKGRGAASNASGRFEAEQRVAFDDGWGLADEEPAPLSTTLSIDSTRAIITRTISDFGRHPDIERGRNTPADARSTQEVGDRSRDHRRGWRL